MRRADLENGTPRQEPKSLPTGFCLSFQEIQGVCLGRPIKWLELLQQAYETSRIGQYGGLCRRRSVCAYQPEMMARFRRLAPRRLDFCFKHPLAFEHPG